MTPTDAQTLHDDAAARGKWLLWTLTDTDIEHPGRYGGPVAAEPKMHFSDRRLLPTHSGHARRPSDREAVRNGHLRQNVSRSMA